MGNATGAVPLAVAGLVRFVCAGDPVPMKISPYAASHNSAMSWNERLMPGARAGGPGGAGAGADLSTADLSTGAMLAGVDKLDFFPACYWLPRGHAPAGAPSANGLDFFPARYWLPRGHARAGVL